VAEGGLGLSPTAKPRTASKQTTAPSASRWGAALRTVLVSPRKGFQALVRADRSSSSETGPQAPVLYALTAFGGAALLLLYFKVRSVFNIGNAEDIKFETGPFATLLVIGAVVALVARWFYSRAVPLVAKDGAARKLRVVWSGAAFPLLFLLLIVLPLDLLITGTGSFTRDWSGSGATAWAGASTALSLGLLLWSLTLFALGLIATHKWKLSKATMYSFFSLIVFLFVGAALVAGILGVVRLLKELNV
jgi:hypothetical protein